MYKAFIERIRRHHRSIAVGLWSVLVFALVIEISLDIAVGVKPLVVRAYVSENPTATEAPTSAAAEVKSTPSLTIDARVTFATRAVSGVTLDAVLYGESGSEGNVSLNPPDETGKSTTIIPASLGGDTISHVSVRASVEREHLDDIHRAMLTEYKEHKDGVFRASTSFQLANGSSRAAPKSTDTKWWLPLAIATIFVTTLIFAPWMNLGTARVLTLVHCSVMLGAFTYACGFVAKIITPGQVLQLSFGHVCWGAYSGVEPTWVFVVGTSESSMGTQNNPLSGAMIGAPLWVMLLSVLGSVLLVVSLLIDQSTKAQSQTKEEMQTDIRLLLRHQFYILFSPVGAVFVYQGLADLNLLDRSLLVGAVSLVAGTAINLILDFGISHMQALFSRAKPTDVESDRRVDHSNTEQNLEVDPRAASQVRGDPPEQ